ncbi:lysosomal alpha-mannosidase-like [Limulus polyphemus]|uniref:alpha-mannosidase n=1 Tax=Limulus polyphemus TaxID=6850 RepID=A0ABM1S193_LIMPO|nr:lysosomal alpha-mannosidase-like [Limulus polyphemus]
MCLSQLVIIALLLSMGTSKPLKQDRPSCGYQSCPQGKPGMLNVHLICHTHDDVGWLKTVDQYFYGANNTIQRAGVQYILDSVIQELRHDPKKRFIYVETAFFWRWWRQQHDHMRHQVQKLVRDGQLEFIGGGWSMNDEATCHYNDIIDQMTWGFRRLSDTFGSCGIPRIGWQIDPFGHSREQASLFAQMYFDGLFLGRIDYQDKSKRQKTQTMEMVWKASDDIGPAADLFTGVLPNTYSPPAGFCFDTLCDSVPIMDDPRLHDYNVNERVDSFIKIAHEQAKMYTTNHIVMTMGEDFNYQNANLWYKNLDKIIKYVNEKQKNGSNVNVFYSTPSCYLYALNQANKTWPTKSDDFFPYASDPHAYWTGYFTSRPSIKGFVKHSNNFLQVCKQLDTLARLGPMDAGDVSVLPLQVSFLFQLVPIPLAVQKIPGRVSKATSELVFNVKLPALGFSTYFIRKSNKFNTGCDIANRWKTRLLREFHLSNGIKLPVKQSFYWYNGMNGNNSEAKFRASGAYIFRPNGTTPYPIDNNVTVTLVTGPLLNEIHQTFSPWISQVIRIYNNTKYAELEWLVGPIPIKNNIGKEIITRFDTNLQSKKKFYTDANGRQVLKRVRNERPTWSLNITEPVSGNYYPVNSRIYIKDDSKNIQLTILTDRSQGGSSLSDGSIELMVHRRLLYDDAFGVGEPLNETGVDGRGLVVRGRHLILLNSTSVAGKQQRELSEKVLLQPWLSFAPFSGSEYEWAKQFTTEYSGLKRPLPPNIHLLTLEQWKGNSVLLRLEHFFEKTDDPRGLSKPANVSLKDMFTPFNVVNVTETTLGANQPLRKASRFAWNIEHNSTRTNVNTGHQRDAPTGPEFNITLNPMEIRTFLVTLNDSVKQLKSIS